MKSGEILLKCTEKPLVPFRCVDNRLAEIIANRMNKLYGNDLAWLGWEDWLSGVQQIHQDKRERYAFGDFIDRMVKLNRVIDYSDTGLKSSAISKEELDQCAAEILTKYLKK